MSGVDRRARARVVAASAVVGASRDSSRVPTLDIADAMPLADAAVDAAPATQVRRPWRTTLRTAFQFIVALAALLPVLVETMGLDAALPVVGAVLAVAAGVTRIMALPQVEDLLQRFLPWLAASPRAS